MSIVKNTNKKTGITYVYESESYWDPEKKQPRNRRKLIGKLDDDGNIIPTGSRGRKRKEEGTSEKSGGLETLMESLSYYDEQLKKAQTENALLQERIRVLEKEKAAILSGLGDILKKHQ
jgi:hypothetical protein